MKRFILFAMVLVLGITGIVVYQHRQLQEPAGASVPPAVATSNETALAPAKPHLHSEYICPMHPEVIRDQPGKCPICGMDLVLKEPQEEDGPPAGASMAAEAITASPAVVALSPAVINQLGVRTAAVRQGTLERHLQAFGTFLRDNPAVFVRPVPGTDPNPQSTFRIVLLAQVFERQALFVQPGRKALVQVPALGANIWEGTVASVDPELNPTTRMQQLRIVLSPEAESAGIKPGMNARVTLEVDPVQDVLLIPREAVIATQNSNRVIMALGSGRFEPRDVVVEDMGEDEVIIRSGLNVGDAIVVSGQFLLDSEASLQAGLRRLATDRQEAQSAHSEEVAK
ncbi:MAG: heavy metal-binding domain-containing protein [Candidatus Competibacteraceae bacterium]